MIHVYTTRNKRTREYKILCHKRYEKYDYQDKNNPVTGAHNATCPKCLDIEIAKAEKALAQMKDHRAHCDLEISTPSATLTLVPPEVNL